MRSSSSPRRFRNLKRSFIVLRDPTSTLTLSFQNQRRSIKSSITQVLDRLIHSSTPVRRITRPSRSPRFSKTQTCSRHFDHSSPSLSSTRSLDVSFRFDVSLSTFGSTFPFRFDVSLSVLGISTFPFRFSVSRRFLSVLGISTVSTSVSVAPFFRFSYIVLSKTVQLTIYTSLSLEATRFAYSIGNSSRTDRVNEVYRPKVLHPFVYTKTIVVRRTQNAQSCRAILGRTRKGGLLK